MEESESSLGQLRARLLTMQTRAERGRSCIQRLEGEIREALDLLGELTREAQQALTWTKRGPRLCLVDEEGSSFFWVVPSYSLIEMGGALASWRPYSGTGASALGEGCSFSEAMALCEGAARRAGFNIANGRGS